ncbi:Putative nicotinamide N-methyltransferase, partial [Leucoagaricus sp. SymC.cos]
EPERPPTPEPTFAIYERKNPLSEPRNIKIRLVGSHPLWAHHLWNASRSFASLLDATKSCENRTVLELGAGGALPSIVAVLSGASKVVVTDYPDAPLIENIRFNIAENVPPSSQDRVSALGYIWGQDIKPLQELLPSGMAAFDVIILSDLIFNHSQHDALLDTCEKSISDDPSACVLVFYSHHRPHLAYRDMEFFNKARSRGWTTDEITTETFPPMFPDDPGDEAVRATVHGWKLTKS